MSLSVIVITFLLNFYLFTERETMKLKRKRHHNHTQFRCKDYKINRSMQRPLFAAVLFRSLKKIENGNQNTQPPPSQAKPKTKAKRTKKTHDDAKQ